MSLPTEIKKNTSCFLIWILLNISMIPLVIKIGDFVLWETGQRIKTVLQNTEVVCRYGGDEFIVVVENCESIYKME